MSDIELFELAKEGDKRAKDILVEENMGLVWSIARRFSGRGYDLEEIFQIGCIGLLKAIDRFDSGYDVQFSTYAVPLIMGEIKRFLRDNGMIKVSRTLKMNGYKINQAREKLSQETGRDPTVNEISKETKLSVEEVVMAIDANREIESIFQKIRGEEEEVCICDRMWDETRDNMANGLLNHILVEQAMSFLDEKQYKLIEMRYFQDKTQLEIAATLGISQVQVSRLEKKVLGCMRNYIDNKSN